MRLTMTETIKECPRGLFLLEVDSIPPEPYTTMASMRSCVITCPFGYYHSIQFKNSPSFMDLNSGSPERHATLKCSKCPSKCTVCFGIRQDQCWRCSSHWVQEHHADFAHYGGHQLNTSVVMSSNGSDCQIYDQLQSIPINRNRHHSLGVVTLLVIISAMFSAIVVFTSYRYFSEWQKGSSTSIMKKFLMPVNVVRNCLERKKYSAIHTEDTRSGWTSRSNQEESLQFVPASAAVKFSGNSRLNNRVMGDDSDFDS